MRLNLATLLARAVDDINKFNKSAIDPKEYLDWVDQYQTQLRSAGQPDRVVDCCRDSPRQHIGQVRIWTCVGCTEDGGGHSDCPSASVLQEQPPVCRKKLEHLVSDFKCCLKEK